VFFQSGKKTGSPQPEAGKTRYEAGRGKAGGEEGRNDTPHEEKDAVAEREVGHEIGLFFHEYPCEVLLFGVDVSNPAPP